LEVRLDGVERNIDAGVANDLVGELPIVVEPALVLVLLNVIVGDRAAGEVRGSLGDGLAR
jgi:hypothetical protein